MKKTAHDDIIVINLEIWNENVVCPQFPAEKTSYYPGLTSVLQNF